MEEDELRTMVVDEKIRPDGRKPDEIRPIWSKVHYVPRVHGSGVFTRGQTQVFTAATLGSLSDAQRLDGILDIPNKRYMHYYNFPPYSVGETRPMRSAGRREIGHGQLAERALTPVLPPEEDFPYTLRLISEVLESNGSSSMASVCGSTLALLDAGVPIKGHVAGVAMGLVLKGKDYAILTDIQGLEDALGEMDFKVAGTVEGITAIQMDIKVQGITIDIMREALAEAKKSRLFIIDKLKETITEPRKELSEFAPRMLVLQISPDKIKDVIGPGGKVINKIIADTGVKIDIENDGRVFIAGQNGAGGRQGQGDGRSAHQVGHGRRDVSRHRHPADELRRVRRVLAGQGRLGPHLAARAAARRAGRGRGQAGRPDHGQGDRGRLARPRQPEPQGGHGARGQRRRGRPGADRQRHAWHGCRSTAPARRSTCCRVPRQAGLE